MHDLKYIHLLFLFPVQNSGIEFGIFIYWGLCDKKPSHVTRQSDWSRRQSLWAPFLSLARSKLRFCSANHKPGYWSILPCDLPSTAWAYFEQDIENGPWPLCQLFWQPRGNLDITSTGLSCLLVCDLNRTPIIMAKHGCSCVHFSGISTCGRTSRETVSHPQRQLLSTPHRIYLPIYLV